MSCVTKFISQNMGKFDTSKTTIKFNVFFTLVKEKKEFELKISHRRESNITQLSKVISELIRTLLNNFLNMFPSHCHFSLVM